ncbi:hypothetical protein [Rhodovulum marinum]|uniref:Uncharacterized protein n=1 Tax=Rhodovulum marinum TaxID=320662 RepID=A0A4R2Q108_9RHOB|nr:hypothetical protein [Rhodovulum marinum]TCP40315.1 hypothetical protein EV662_108190 [Rhodovulum marinum]
MATNSSFEERLRRIGAERGEAAGTTAPAAIPDERGTTKRLVAGISAVLVLAVGVSVANTVIGAGGADGRGSLAEDGWEPVVSRGVPVGAGTAERVEDGWLRIQDKD